MKLIIDISKNEYNDIIEQVKKCDYPDMGLGKIIANGTPYNTTGDLISRSELISAKKVVRDTKYRTTKDRIYAKAWNACNSYWLNIIDNAPTVELQMGRMTNGVIIPITRHKGKWVNHRNDYGHNIADCSLCGKAMQWHDEDEDDIPRYCWYCGADMRGEEE
jgi:hypothetical protein